MEFGCVKRRAVVRVQDIYQCGRALLPPKEVSDAKKNQE